jgi:hypothetical protein
VYHHQIKCTGFVNNEVRIPGIWQNRAKRPPHSSHYSGRMGRIRIFFWQNHFFSGKTKGNPRSGFFQIGFNFQGK